jgi:hypothetical protein
MLPGAIGNVACDSGLGLCEPKNLVHRADWKRRKASFLIRDYPCNPWLPCLPWSRLPRGLVKDSPTAATESQTRQP